MGGFFSALSEMGGLLHSIPKEKVYVGQTEFPLPKESQLESTAFSINIYPLAFLPLELFFPK